MTRLVWIIRLIAKIVTINMEFAACRVGDPEIVVEIHGDDTSVSITCQITQADPEPEPADGDPVATAWSPDRRMKWEIYADLEEHWSGLGTFKLRARSRSGKRRRLRRVELPRVWAPAGA